MCVANSYRAFVMRVLLKQQSLRGSLDTAFCALRLPTTFEFAVSSQQLMAELQFLPSSTMWTEGTSGGFFSSYKVRGSSAQLASNHASCHKQVCPSSGIFPGYSNSFRLSRSEDGRTERRSRRGHVFDGDPPLLLSAQRKGRRVSVMQAQSPSTSPLVQANTADSLESSTLGNGEATSTSGRQFEEGSGRPPLNPGTNGRGNILGETVSKLQNAAQVVLSSFSEEDGSAEALSGGASSEASVSGSETSQEYARELEVATYAVQLACLLSQRIQRDILRDRDQAKLKKDKSPVTVADYGVQAVISYILSEAFPHEPLSMVAEESTDALKGRDEMSTLRRVVDAVNDCLSNSPLVGLAPPASPLSTIDVLKAINRGAHEGGKEGRFWVLDPVDGTLGFVRGDQYAVALALVDRGEVVLGVLGCPNLPLRKEWMRYGHRFYRAAETFFPPEKGLWHKGIVFRARKGGGGAWAEPLISADVPLEGVRSQARRATVSAVTDPAKATFCEPVEKANSNQSLTAGLAEGLGISTAPLRAYSMAKYGMLAKGDAEIFMKFARGDYKEKIWDHAAGCFIVEEAGGVVTDAGGRPLDFSRGRFLTGLDRGIIASCNPSLHQRLLAALDASYDSSTL